MQASAQKAYLSMSLQQAICVRGDLLESCKCDSRFTYSVCCSSQHTWERKGVCQKWMRVSGAVLTLVAATAVTLAGIAYIHEGQRLEREVSTGPIERSCPAP